MGLLQALVLLLGNNQKHFDLFCLPVAGRGSELPLVQRAEDKLRLLEPGRKCKRQRFKPACLIHEAVNENSIGVECVGANVGPHDVKWPWRFQARDIPRLQSLA